MGSRYFSSIGRALHPSQYADRITQAVGEHLDGIQKNSIESNVYSQIVENFNASTPSEPLEIVVHPNYEVIGDLPFASNCHPPSPSQWALWIDSLSSISQQFAEYGIPIRFRADATQQFNESKPHIPVLHCGSFNETMQTAAAAFFQSADTRIDQSIIARDDVPSITTNIHEIGHALGLAHPHSIWNHRTIQADLMGIVCEGSSNQPPSVMEYSGVCADLGYHSRLFNIGSTQKRFGPIEIAALQEYTAPFELKASVRGNSTNSIYDLIAARTGARVTGFFAGACVATILERLLSQAVVRSISCPHMQKSVLCVLNLVIKLIHASIIAMHDSANIAFDTIVHGASAFVSDNILRTGVFSESLRALGDLVSTVHIASAFYALLRGNVWPAAGFAAGIGGRATGMAISMPLEYLMNRCLGPLSAEQEAARMNSKKSSIKLGAKLVPERFAETYKQLARWDEQLSRVIDGYFAESCSKCYLFAQDQNKQGVDKLINDINAIFTKEQPDQEQSMAETSVKASAPASSTHSEIPMPSTAGDSTVTAIPDIRDSSDTGSRSEKSTGKDWGPPPVQIQDI